jgi:HPt (histidine-containing phosphotransfer) domain-containing protein
MNEEPSFNPAAVERLLKLGGRKFALDMINLFGSYGSQKLAAARQAHGAGNLKALAESAHPLKSSAGNVGALRVQALAEAVESLAVEGQAGPAGQKFAELEKAFAEVNVILDAERARLAGPAS